MTKIYTPYDLLGMNYGHVWPESRGVSDPVGCQGACDEIWSFGIRYLRWNILAYDTVPESEWLEFKAAIEIHLAKGFHCQWGIQHTGKRLTLSTQNGEYRNRALDLANWMHGLLVAHPEYIGKLELCVGNEDDNYVDNITLTESAHRAWRSNDLIDDIKAIDSNILTSFSTHSGFMTAWFATGVGKLDAIGMQFYNVNGAQTWVAQCRQAFGNKFYMSEWSTYNDGGVYGKNNYASDEAWWVDFKRMFYPHRRLRIRSYYFAWRVASIFPTLQGLVMKYTNGTFASAFKKILLNPANVRLYDDTPLQRKGVVNKSVYFNGVNSKMIIPIIVNNTSFNISVWIYSTRQIFGTNGAGYPIMESISSDGNARWGFKTDASSPVLYMYTKDSAFSFAFAPGGNIVSLGKWRHYVLHHDNVNGMKMYLDKVLVASVPTARLGIIDTNITLMNLGSIYRPGSLAQLVVDNGPEWTQDIVNGLYSGSIPSSVEGYYPFNGDSYDYSGNGNDAIETNVIYKNFAPI